MKPVLLWSKPLPDIAAHLEGGPEDFIVVDTNSYHDFQKLSKLRSDTPIFDPFPRSGQHYRDFLNHVNASHCRHHIVGLAACQEVLRTLKDPSLSGATIEEVLLALGYLGQGRPKPQQVISPLTIFLGRLIGLFLVLFSLAALMDRQTMVEAADTLLHNRALLLIAGMIAVLGGLAIVLTHNLWSGGALPVVITILGWIILARGLLLLFLPPSAMVNLWQMLHFEEFFYVYLIIVLGLGLYLTYAGFKSSPSSASRSKH
jgi:hypothetical protein